MFCRRLALAGFLCVLAAGCGGRGKRPVERLAVPPFENLSDDATLGWAGWALSEVVAAELTGSQRLHPLRVSSGGDAALAGATSVLRGYFTVAGGRLRLRVENRDLTRNRATSHFSAEEAFPEGLFRAAGSVARWVEPGAHAFDTDNLAALTAFAQGREAEEAEAAVTAFERALSSDPDFGGAYVAWARALLQRGNRHGVVSVIEKARARGDRISEARRIELELVQSMATNDADLRRKALEALSRLTPADAEVFRQLGREERAARRYDSAAGFYRRVTVLDPLDQDAWNQLGYTEAARRNLDAEEP